jgi:hypothetical protein
MKNIFLIFLLSVSLQAKDAMSNWFSNGRFIQESESQKMTNEFGGKLDFTDDANFLTDWREHWNSVSNINHTNGVYIVLFVASKFEVEEQDSTFDLTIKKPDGSIYACFTNLTAAKQHYYPATGPHELNAMLEPSSSFTILQIDPQDPVGIFTIEAVLQDKLRKNVVKLQKQLVVEK